MPWPRSACRLVPRASTPRSPATRRCRRPQGQTFTVVPIGGMATTGGLEFQRYAGIVAQQLQARGYQPAATAPEREHGRPARLFARSWAGPSRIGPRSTAAASAMAGSATARSFTRATAASGSDRLSITAGTTRSSTAAAGSTAGSSIKARSTSTSARREPTSRCSTDAPRRDRRPIGSTCSSRIWSRPCSPDSRARAARRSRSPFRCARAPDARALSEGKEEGPADRSAGSFLSAVGAAETLGLAAYPSSWRVSSRMSASSSASAARSFSIWRTAWITVV